MQTVDTRKTKGQASVTDLVEQSKLLPGTAIVWGATAGGALVGGAVTVAAAQGIVALFTLLAAPPIAWTVGALGGGWVGWHYMRRQGGNPKPPSGVNPKPPHIMRNEPCAVLADDLELINGVTATYAARLHAAGVHTFAQLAELTPERVHLIIGPTYYDNLIHSTNWIAEARRLATHNGA